MSNLLFSVPDFDRSPISSAYLSGRSRESDANNFLGAVSKLFILWAKCVYWNLSFWGTSATCQTCRIKSEEMTMIRNFKVLVLSPVNISAKYKKNYFFIPSDMADYWLQWLELLINEFTKNTKKLDCKGLCMLSIDMCKKLTKDTWIYQCLLASHHEVCSNY